MIFILAKSFLFGFAGFLWEVLITSYHRCVMLERNFFASLLATFITMMSLLVLSTITKEIIMAHGLQVYLYILVFSLAKGAGAYTSLYLWSKKQPPKKAA